MGVERHLRLSNGDLPNLDSDVEAASRAVEDWCQANPSGFEPWLGPAPSFGPAPERVTVSYVHAAADDPITLVELVAEFNALTPDIEVLKRLAGHGLCDGWSLGGQPYRGRCGCGVPLDDLAYLVRQSPAAPPKAALPLPTALESETTE